MKNEECRMNNHLIEAKLIENQRCKPILHSSFMVVHLKHLFCKIFITKCVFVVALFSTNCYLGQK